jgi:hypothetical protein
MEIVGSVPRGTNSEGYIGSVALKERVVDVGLKLSGLWGDWGAHEREERLTEVPREPSLVRESVGVKLAETYTNPVSQSPSCRQHHILHPVSPFSLPLRSLQQNYSPQQTPPLVSPYLPPHLSQPLQQEIKKLHLVRIFMIGHSTRPVQPKYRPPHSRFFSQKLFNTCRSALVVSTTSNVGKS